MCTHYRGDSPCARIKVADESTKECVGGTRMHSSSEVCVCVCVCVCVM